jgi:putative serine/threonine protein kinase
MCYPRYDADEAERRIRELRRLGVDAIELRGRHLVCGLPTLGKGHVGVVVGARGADRLMALKIRRVDADRGSLEEEASHQRAANTVDVGPKLVGASANFILMELIEGNYLTEWIEGLEPSEAPRLNKVLTDLLRDARRLDLIDLDHGELSNARRHVMVAGDVPCIVDFESSSTRRKVSNVTSIVQYLYFNRLVRGTIERLMTPPQPNAILGSLRKYKAEPTEGSFSELLKSLDLDSSARIER